MDNIFDGKTVAITGGTGSFGSTFTEKLLSSNVSKVIIFSRDEFKQHEMNIKFNNDPKIKFTDYELDLMHGMGFAACMTLFESHIDGKNWNNRKNDASWTGWNRNYEFEY